MNTLRTLIAGASAVSALALASSAFAADPVNNATANVTANFISALNVAKSKDMDFGVATRPGTGGAVLTVSTGGTVTADSGTTVTNSTGQAAVFNLTGAVGDSATIQTDYTPGDAGFSVDTFTYSGCSISGTTVSLGTSACALNVGGKLHAPAGASGSVNAGSIKVTINYGS